MMAGSELKAWVEFEPQAEGGVHVIPHAIADQPRQVRYELVVEAASASGHASTRQSGEVSLDSSPRRLSTLRLKQQGEGNVKAELTVEAADGSRVQVIERYE